MCHLPTFHCLKYCCKMTEATTEVKQSKQGIRGLFSGCFCFCFSVLNEPREFITKYAAMGIFDFRKSGTTVSKPTGRVAVRDILNWVDHCSKES